MQMRMYFFLTSIRPSKNDPPPTAAAGLLVAAVLPNGEVLLLWLALVAAVLPNGLEEDDAGLLLLPLVLEQNPDHPDVARSILS